MIQFTPPGSGCSVIFGENVTAAAPGSAQGLYLIVSDVEAARAELLGRDVAISEVFHAAADVVRWARMSPTCLGGSGSVVRTPSMESYRSFASFGDPDGNGWLFQEITTRLPGRVAGDTTYASASDLSQALRRAAAAHGQHEARTGKPTRTGPTGTPSTWCASRPAKSCRNDRRLARAFGAPRGNGRDNLRRLAPRSRRTNFPMLTLQRAISGL